MGAYRTAENALANLKRSFPEIMLVDIGLPGMSQREKEILGGMDKGMLCVRGGQ